MLKKGTSYIENKKQHKKCPKVIYDFFTLILTNSYYLLFSHPKTQTYSMERGGEDSATPKHKPIQWRGVSATPKHKPIQL